MSPDKAKMGQQQERVSRHLSGSQFLPQVQTSTAEDKDIQKSSPSLSRLKQNKTLFNPTQLGMPWGNNKAKLFAGQRPQDNKEYLVSAYATCGKWSI